MPGLDGLRGLAVVGVLLYHSGFGWARGGWLGVSAFFTLSGFLITSLLLAELSGSGRVSLRDFGGRRVRRLLPALVATVAAVVVASRWAALPSSLANLRGDAWATLGQVANWHFLVRGQSYGAQFEATSPLLHTWSLSIEAQAYVVLPLLVVGSVALARRLGRGTDGTTGAASLALGALLVASMAAGAFLATSGASVDRLYFGTDVRLAELLAGSLLAIAVRARPVERWSRDGGQSLDAAGLLLLVIGLGAWALADQADRAFYPIGLWVHAAGAAVVIAAVRVQGVTARLLAVRPLRSVGMMSYGIYLYHWPIFTWLTPERSGWPDPAVHGLRWGLTLGLAAASFRFLEEPIRRRRGLMATPPRWLAPAALGATAALVLTVATPGPGAHTDFVAASERLADLTVTVPSSSPSTPVPDEDDGEAPLPPPTVAFVGDSTGVINALGLAEWAESTGRIGVTPGLVRTSCGLLPGPHHRMEGARFGHNDDCPDWAAGLGPFDEAATFAVVNFGPWDMAEHLIDGFGWGYLGQGPVDDAFHHEMSRLTDALIEDGMNVVWLLPPAMVFNTQDGVLPAERVPASDPARLDRFRELVGEVVQARPGRAATLDLRTYLETLPGGELDPRARPDMIHFTIETATEMAGWLGPEIIELAARMDPAPRALAQAEALTQE